MKSRILAALSLGVVLSACAAVEGPEKNGVSIAFKNDGAKAFVAGFQPVEVKIEQSVDKDVEGQCRLDSSKYSASFTAPATVNIPAYSQGAVNATLSCEVDGQTHAATFKPVNLSKRARNNSSLAVGILVCPICGLGMAVGDAIASEETGVKDGDIYGFIKMDLKI